MAAMHADEHAITAHKARALIAAQMPDLAGLALRRVGTSGTDNVLFRLGPGLVARFPRLPHAARQIDHLVRWMPRLPVLPLAVPKVTRLGQPGEDYPFNWSVGPWLAGRDALTAPPDQTRAAHDLTALVQMLHSLPVPKDAPPRGPALRLEERLASAADYLPMFEPDADTAHLRDCLNAARALDQCTGPPLWVHGDLHPLNLLTRAGRLTAGIDWGGMGVGDPASDLIPAWTLFDAPARTRFRALLHPDPQAWDRGRAFALAMAVMAIPYYRQTNPLFHRAMSLTLTRVLEDWR